MKLPLIEIFCGHSEELIKAARDGVKTHGTRNIRESGRPLEKAVQRLFNNSMPSIYIALSGYFFHETQFVLSNQVDFMLCDTGQALRLPPSASLDESYVGRQCLKCLGQIKSSATPRLIKEALKQHQDSLRHFGNAQEIPSFIIFGLKGNSNNNSKNKIKLALEVYRGPLPTIIACLEEGVIFYSDDSSVSLQPYGCQKIKHPAEVRGAALVFLYCILFERMRIEPSPPFIKSLKSLLMKYPFSPES